MVTPPKIPETALAWYGAEKGDAANIPFLIAHTVGLVRYDLSLLVVSSSTPNDFY